MRETLGTRAVRHFGKQSRAVGADEVEVEGFAGAFLGVLLGAAVAYGEGLATYGDRAWSLVPPGEAGAMLGGCLIGGMVLTVLGALYPAYQAARTAYYTLLKGPSWLAEERARISRAEVGPEISNTERQSRRPRFVRRNSKRRLTWSTESRTG
jgi:hypothetical protein